MRKGLLLLIIAFQFAIFEVHADTVVGIHGFLAKWRSLIPIRSTLQNCGFDVCLWQYPSRQKFIEEHACDLVTFLQDLACQYPGEPIHFVTHSIGALVLRAAVNLAECPEEAKIGRVVMIAPSNQGSYLARRTGNMPPISLAMGKRAGWQLTHYGPDKINCFGELPSTMQVLVIAGCHGNRIFFSVPNDCFLTVEETLLNTPHSFACFKASHGDLLTTPAVLRCMRDFFLKECD